MDLLAGKMLGFILVLTRIGAFFSVSPVFSWQAIPMKVKMSMAILASIFFSSITTSALNSENLD
ncbi:MAG: flagellar biosynthetic protein FliR, partial [Planctomycetota bacterium]